MENSAKNQLKKEEKKSKKYKELAIIFLKRLVDIDRELTILQEQLETGSQKNIIRLSFETGDIIPLLKVEEVLEIEDNKDEIEEELFRDISDLTSIKDTKNMEQKIEEFIEKYM